MQKWKRFNKSICVVDARQHQTVSQHTRKTLNTSLSKNETLNVCTALNKCWENVTRIFDNVIFLSLQTEFDSVKLRKSNLTNTGSI